MFKSMVDNLILCESFKDMLTFLTSIIAVGSFVKVIMEYTKAQSWKRAEFLASVMKEFNSDPNVRLARTIIDWKSRDFELFPDQKNEEDKRVWINDQVLIEALTPEDWKGTIENKVGYENSEVRIRDIFDAFFERLATINHYLDTKLITESDLRPYITYWIGLINDSRSEELLQQIHAFLKRYKYDDVIKLLETSKKITQSTK